MGLFYDFVHFTTYFSILIIFLILAIIFAKKLHAWIWYSIGAVITFFSVYGNHITYDYSADNYDPSIYWMIYIALLLISAVIIFTRYSISQENSEEFYKLYPEDPDSNIEETDKTKKSNTKKSHSLVKKIINILKCIFFIPLSILASEMLLMLVLGNSVEGVPALILLFVVAALLFTLLYYLFIGRKNKTKLTQLINESYKPKYFDQCKFIWKNYVQKNGQSNVLQGELLRAVEKLRYEAQDNGNINWDDNFSFFCEFIKETLCAQEIYTDDEKVNYRLILDYFKECGNYAIKVRDRKIPDKKVKVEKIAYVYDNLYDILADAIGKFYASHPDPIHIETSAKRKSVNFEEINSRDKAREEFRKGNLEILYLLSPMFGGSKNEDNILYVPIGIGKLKKRYDNIVADLLNKGKVKSYDCRPEYKGDSFVPSKITIISGKDGNIVFKETINIW